MSNELHEDHIHELRTIIDENLENIENNYGAVKINRGVVENNYGRVDVNKKITNDNYGFVDINEGIIENNYGRIEKNHGTIIRNYGIIIENLGYIVTNSENVDSIIIAMKNSDDQLIYYREAEIFEVNDSEFVALINTNADDVLIAKITNDDEYFEPSQDEFKKVLEENKNLSNAKLYPAGLQFVTCFY